MGNNNWELLTSIEGYNFQGESLSPLHFCIVHGSTLIRVEKIKSWL